MAYHSISNPGMDNIPNFLRARSPQGLRRLMRRNNLRLRAFIKYDIQWVDSEKQWYAWYYVDFERLTDQEKGELDG